jgi:sec-independent protein translocase protein TatA
MPFGLGWPEVLVVLAVALVLFGHKLPAAARSLGRSLVEFKKGVSDLQGDLSRTLP